MARAWSDAHRSLSVADEVSALGAEDLERLATAAYMLGHDDEHHAALERAHQAYVDEADPVRAVRCAFWLSLTLMLRGEAGRATGWLGRAQRLLERDGRDCVERGYLLVPVVAQHEIAGDYRAAHAAATAAAEIAERFGDADLLAIAMHSQGNALVAQGQVGEGLALLDETMVAVVSGELSPIVTGLMYCSVIDGCRRAYALRRAQEWTAALTRWCEEQPDMVAFTGRCLVHRAEIMQLHGAWDDALREARRAGGRPSQAAGQAFYRQAELHRLQGEFVRAEAAYRDASRCGTEPQPGLALLRLVQDNGEAAAAAIRRVAAETTERIERVRLLPAYVEIMLAVGDADAAASACGELEQLARGFESGMLDAVVAHARGAVDLDAGDPRAALVALRQAGSAWQELGAPYEAARVRVLVGLACRALGDDDSAALELDAARDVFAELRAAPDVARVDALSGSAVPAGTHGLTPRELQVLRLVAAGATNKAIAAELVLSERTVDRHVSNIFAKLGASSRSAATAYAYRHQLV
jgi:DNA-binding CsgD family transcriptional regulator